MQKIAGEENLIPLVKDTPTNANSGNTLDLVWLSAKDHKEDAEAMIVRRKVGVHFPIFFGYPEQAEKRSKMMRYCFKDEHWKGKFRAAVTYELFAANSKGVAPDAYMSCRPRQLFS